MKYQPIQYATLVLVSSLALLVISNINIMAQETPDITGTYVLQSGMIKGKPIDDAAKKAEYVITANSIIIRRGDEVEFHMNYKLIAKAKPYEIDMVIVRGPEGTKGAVAAGIIDVSDGTLKLAYHPGKDNRPSDFSGQKGMLFVLVKKK